MFLSSVAADPQVKLQIDTKIYITTPKLSDFTAFDDKSSFDFWNAIMVTSLEPHGVWNHLFCRG